MNPAYIIRQMFDEFPIEYGVLGRIVSLKPLNPKNTPDEWERKALLGFEKGEKEKFEFTAINGEEYLRLMKPMTTEKSCLKCHAFQGYKVGDIRGGVGVSIKMSPLWQASSQQRNMFSFFHLLILFVGFVGIWGASMRISKNASEQIIANETIKNAKLKFHTIVDFTYDWEYWIKNDNLLEYVSPSCERITGYSADEFLGNNKLLDEIIIDEDKLIWEKHNAETGIETLKLREIQFRIKRKDDQIVWIEHACQPVIDKNGIPHGFRASNRDITERKQTEEARKRETQLVQTQKMEAIGTLAGGIAHDFNNLLCVVMGNISLALDDLNLDMETSEILKEAEDACILAKELSARLITFSKGGNPVKEMISINDLVKDMVVSVLRGSNINPEISITNTIRNVNIDEDQIKQVVRNIVINAKEAMNDNGQLTVSCENIDIGEEGFKTLRQGKYIKISFEDNGCGISEKNLEKIFDPYFSTKDMGAYKGQGLGLTVTYSIIQKHGGLINVESEPQRGTTISIYLPVFLIKEPDLEKSETKPTEQKPIKQPATGKVKILVIDDEEIIRTLMGQMLTRLGYDVETCIEGKEAVDIYKKAMKSKESFDLVILDLINKIGMGGQKTMERLLELDPDVKGIITATYSDSPIVTNFRAYGFSGFITKPATMDALSKIVNEVISKGQ